MISLLFVICFILTLQNACAKKSNIFLRTNINLFDDDDLHRHGSSKGLYDAINPAPTKSPSFVPSSTPSTHPSATPSNYPSVTPSVTSCSSTDGGFGNIDGPNMEIVSFRYEVQVNKTTMTTHPDNHADETNEKIIPRVEDLLLELLLPDLFDGCSNGNSTSNSTDLFASVEGVSSQPKDQMDRTECTTYTDSEHNCYPMDGEFYLFFDSRRRLVDERREVREIKNIVKNLMNDGKMDSAHPSVVSIRYVERNVQPTITSPEEKMIVNQSSSSSSQTSTMMMIGIGVGAAAVVLCTILLIRRKMKSNGDQDDGSSNSSSTSSIKFSAPNEQSNTCENL